MTLKPELSSNSRVGSYSYYFDGTTSFNVNSYERDTVNNLAYYNLKEEKEDGNFYPRGSIEAWINVNTLGTEERVIVMLQGLDGQIEYALYP